MASEAVACVFCGEQVRRAAKKCRHCGERLVATAGHLGDPKDVVSPVWLALVWLSILLPFAGPWIVVVLSSVLYFVWRRDFPNRARSINRAGWTAWLLGNVAWCLVFSVLGASR